MEFLCPFFYLMPIPYVVCLYAFMFLRVAHMCVVTTYVHLYNMDSIIFLAIIENYVTQFVDVSLSPSLL